MGRRPLSPAGVGMIPFTTARRSESYDARGGRAGASDPTSRHERRLRVHSAGGCRIHLCRICLQVNRAQARLRRRTWPEPSGIPTIDVNDNCATRSAARLLTNRRLPTTPSAWQMRMSSSRAAAMSFRPAKLSPPGRNTLLQSSFRTDTTQTRSGSHHPPREGLSNDSRLGATGSAQAIPLIGQLRGQARAGQVEEGEPHLRAQHRPRILIRRRRSTDHAKNGQNRRLHAERAGPPAMADPRSVPARSRHSRPRARRESCNRDTRWPGRPRARFTSTRSYRCSPRRGRPRHPTR